MSLWTHVSGAIRFDGVVIRGNNEIMLKGLRKTLGNTCNFDSPKEDWDKCNVPCGSEGSLQYEIYEYHTGLPWAIVPIWGDLRDFGSEEQVRQIKDWFYRVCKDWGLVRQGILQIQVGSEEGIILQYTDKEAKP
jgi:hypothetical protein